MTVPPYAVAGVMTILVGWFADRTGQRGYSNIFCATVGNIGFFMLIAGETPAVRYGGTFLGASGIFPCIANTITWVANNSEGIYKRGIVLGFVIGWGNINGIVSGNIYRFADAPHFVPGHSAILAYMIFCLFCGSIAMHILLRRENAKRRAGGRDYRMAGKTQSEIDRLGDNRPDFFYTL